MSLFTAEFYHWVRGAMEMVIRVSAHWALSLGISRSVCRVLPTDTIPAWMSQVPRSNTTRLLRKRGGGDLSGCWL